MTFLILFLVAVVISSLGFKKFIWFISLGYGYSIAGIGVALMLIYNKSLSPLTGILCGLLIVYGLRLGGYLMIRELKSASYKSTLKNEVKDGSKMNFFIKVVIWLSCALLYVCEASPVWFRLKNGAPSDTTGIVGLCILILGLVLESTADFTKNKYKKANPKRFCDVGVFKIVRCPNYLGEVLIWTGVFISGCTVYTGALQWLAAIGGYISIVYIMFGGARCLELRQNKNYGNDPEYQTYVKKTPILLPLVPLYSVAKYKWLVG